MATIKLRISVSELTNVMSLFDKIMVYRSTTGIDGTYSEITDAGTRIDLVAGTTVYTYDDTGGANNYYYKTSYYNSTTFQESSLSNPIKGEGAGNYVTLQEFRDEGVTEAQASDSRLLMLIDIWEKFIEEQTGNFFTSRDLTLKLDGNDSDTLFLPFPIISVTSLKINDSTTALNSNLYVVYNNDFEDKRNPKIRLKRARSVDIFQRYAYGADDYFVKGYRNQEIVGSFGYLENNSCPPLIAHAVRKLVIQHTALEGVNTGAAPSGGKIREKTDGHEIEYSDRSDQANVAPLISNDAEVDRIIQMYRRPLQVETVKNWFEPVLIK